MYYKSCPQVCQKIFSGPYPNRTYRFTLPADLWKVVARVPVFYFTCHHQYIDGLQSQLSQVLPVDFCLCQLQHLKKQEKTATPKNLCINISGNSSYLQLCIQESAQGAPSPIVLSFTQYTQSVLLGKFSTIVYNRFTRLSFNIVRYSNIRLPSELRPTDADSYVVYLAYVVRQLYLIKTIVKQSS